MTKKLNRLSLKKGLRPEVLPQVCFKKFNILKIKTMNKFKYYLACTILYLSIAAIIVILSTIIWSAKQGTLWLSFIAIYMAIVFATLSLIAKLFMQDQKNPNY
jgi:hypothetical protein